MRQHRFKAEWEYSYYHCATRIVGGEYLLGNEEKQKLLQTILRLLTYYQMEVIVHVALSNHYHAIIGVNPEPPELEDIKRRWKAYYGEDRPEPDWENAEVVDRLSRRMRDISFFMKDLNQILSAWYNKRKGRKGAFWGSRFMSVLLDKGEALWECAKYVEMNPVRAGICSDPADYDYGSWGQYCKTGKHPFGSAFFDAMRDFFGDIAKDASDEEIAARFAASMAGQAAHERGGCSDDIDEAKNSAREMMLCSKKRRPCFDLSLLGKVGHWTNGRVVGSAKFIREAASRIICMKLSKGKKIAQGSSNKRIYTLGSIRK